MTGADAAHPLSPEVCEGAILAGRYRVERTLGVGGMGVVVAAHHLELDERVAIKFLLPAAAADADAVGRFAREAWATAKIKSEYVTRISDVGRLDSGAPFIVMEYLEGIDLAEMLRVRGPLEVEAAVELVLQACEAIAEAHALGIVHRDLKPSNLFCVRRSDGLLAIKVLDFGISKITRPLGSSADLRLTVTSSTVGSPLYMSPEQMSSSKVVDERSDIWALGVILQELVTGRVPFHGSSLPELAINIATEPPEPMLAPHGDLPHGLQRVVTRCLEKKRERRYASVAELAFALAAFANPRASAHAERAERVLLASTQGVRLPLSDPGFQRIGSHARLRSGSRARFRLWRRWPSLVVLSLLLAAGAAAWVLALRSGNASQRTPTAAVPRRTNGVLPARRPDDEARRTDPSPSIDSPRPRPPDSLPESAAVEPTATDSTQPYEAVHATPPGSAAAAVAGAERTSGDVVPRVDASGPSRDSRLRPAKQERKRAPAAAATRKKSDLDDLGGRL